jgi:hypothetical protein
MADYDCGLFWVVLIWRPCLVGRGRVGQASAGGGEFALLLVNSWWKWSFSSVGNPRNKFKLLASHLFRHHSRVVVDPRIRIDYEGLFQKLSTALVKPHIGIATTFAED